MAILLDYNYPGNLRELENIIEHAFVLCSSGLIETRHLPPQFRSKGDIDALKVKRGVTLKALEAIHITDALHRHGGNRTAAARELGIDPSTLSRKIKSLEIELPEKDGRSRKGT